VFKGSDQWVIGEKEPVLSKRVQLQIH